MKSKFLSNIRNVARQVSTRPNRSSWIWKGVPSPLAFITLYSIYILRLFSLLQWSKYLIYRSPIAFNIRKRSTDRAAKRINIPSYFVEIHAVLWCIILFLLPSNTVTKGIAWYYMTMTSVWLLYYFFFRRFFEERYAIMHRLEYVVLLPVLVIGQVQAIRIIHGFSAHDAVISIFTPQDYSPIGIILLSVIYTALIFGMFLSNMPTENVKEQGNYRYNFTVIGNGQIVQNRLLPALKSSDIRRAIVYDIVPPLHAQQKFGNTDVDFALIDGDNIDKSILVSNVLWIATPSFHHLEYLEKYIHHLFIVIEKPLVTTRKELDILTNLRNSTLWNNVFCLSYYYLEKALPLVYLYRPLFFYKKYLTISCDRSALIEKMEQLGKLQEIDLTLYEGEDTREWLKEGKHGGQLLETFIHLAVITRTIIGKKDFIINEKWLIRDYKEYKKAYIQCSGKSPDNQTIIKLQMGKFMPQKQHDGILKYEKGYIKVDFENPAATAILTSDEDDITLFTVNLKQPYNNIKYGIQLDMAERCYNEHLTPSLVDGVDYQLDVLNWLLSVDNLRINMD